MVTRPVERPVRRHPWNAQRERAPGYQRHVVTVWHAEQRHLAFFDQLGGFDALLRGNVLRGAGLVVRPEFTWPPRLVHRVVARQDSARQQQAGDRRSRKNLKSVTHDFLPFDCCFWFWALCSTQGRFTPMPLALSTRGRTPSCNEMRGPDWLRALHKPWTRVVQCAVPPLQTIRSQRPLR